MSKKEDNKDNYRRCSKISDLIFKEIYESKKDVLDMVCCIVNKDNIVNLYSADMLPGSQRMSTLAYNLGIMAGAKLGILDSAQKNKIPDDPADRRKFLEYYLRAAAAAARLFFDGTISVVDEKTGEPLMDEMRQILNDSDANVFGVGFFRNDKEEEYIYCDAPDVKKREPEQSKKRSKTIATNAAFLHALTDCFDDETDEDEDE